MADPTKPAVAVVDPSLRSADGHHLDALERYRLELSKLGLSSTALVSRFVSDDFGREADLVPTFERSVYYRSQWTRTEFEECAQKFCAELRSGLRKLRLRPDIIILPVADQATISGLARYLKGSGSRPEILLCLMMAPNYKKAIDDPAVAPLLEEYRESFRALRDIVSDDRIHVYSETDAMARAYEPHVGLKIETMIVQKLIARPRDRRVRRLGEPINIVCTGNANVAKGYSLLPDAITILNKRRGDLRFLIHGTVEQTDYPEGREVLRRIADLDPSVTVRTDVLSTEDYLAWLGEGDLVLQPYDPQVYRTRGSGVFVEALKLGIPVVATKGCAFAEQAIENGRAFGIEAFDAKSVASAILTAADRIDELSTRAANFAEKLGADRDVQALLAKAVAGVEKRLVTRKWWDRVLRR